MTATADRNEDRYFIRQAIERIIDDSAILEAKNGEEALPYTCVEGISFSWSLSI
ncbi:hypothetical protein GO730_36015 [Spirosoma sp. HMF3257]|uniref:hypothetical protein n=1 Tax=Spirosoma telluris TaxID=2183553 RepID=UPI0012F972E2|nr:hypothetical protein [Spirosoma telluris]